VEPSALPATDERRALRRLSLAFAVVAALALLDLAGDVTEGGEPWHLAIEAAVVAVGAAGAVWGLRRLRELAARTAHLREQAADLQARLEATRAQAETFRRDAADLLHGLGAAIDRQLAAWGLTPAEKEIALLLLKGLSHREIAGVRDVSEDTVRQQARSIYRKAGLAGRADLAAFFLEDMLAPATR
jgi:DNA-binding CsgD family transcriptional regulator